MAALEDHEGSMERKDGKRYQQGTRNPWVKPLVQFALETAMRQGELLSLAWVHADLRRRVSFLPETKNGNARSAVV